MASHVFLQISIYIRIDTIITDMYIYIYIYIHSVIGIQVSVLHFTSENIWNGPFQTTSNFTLLHFNSTQLGYTLLYFKSFRLPRPRRKIHSLIYGINSKISYLFLAVFHFTFLHFNSIKLGLLYFTSIHLLIIKAVFEESWWWWSLYFKCIFEFRSLHTFPISDFRFK